MRAIDRRNFLKLAGCGGVAVSVFGCGYPYGLSVESPGKDRKPNIIYILADDLGYTELGCYGQKKIKTPNLDRLAAGGMKFTQHYSGSPVCAPSRCALLTGLHTGHAYIRDNDEMGERGDVWHDPALEGQRPLPPDTVTIGTILQQAGYKTACVGKWGLGGPGSTGHPNRQGFDLFYGYLCQRVAHNYYPAHLWENENRVTLKNEQFSPHQRFPADKDPSDKANYARYSGTEYAPDLMTEKTLAFIRDNRDNPFFLYLAWPVPHVALQVPEDSLKQYEGVFPDWPYKGQAGYLPHYAPRAAYAAMITRMDDYVGKLMNLLKELGLDDNTVVMFSSDNGTAFNGGTDAKFFESVGTLRGLKCEVYEGGIRVPMIARWPGKIRAGTTSDRISAFWDVLPTVADIAGRKPPKDIDGISMLPTLLGKSAPQKRHEYLYWEYAGRIQAVRMGDFKAVRHHPKKQIELYNLAKDIGETTDVSEKHPDIVAKMAKIMTAGRTESELFPLQKELPKKKKN